MAEAYVGTVTVAGHAERIAHLGKGFTTVLSGNAGATGHVTLRGCLIWDRYLWTEYQAQPKRFLRLMERVGHLVQHEAFNATKHAGVFAVSSESPMKLLRRNHVRARGFVIHWNVLTVELV